MHGNKTLTKMFLRGRHYGISLIIGLQSYRSSIDPVMRE